ncbi:MAG: hypothetical protein N2596_02100 [Syntrophorhabdaceae bacterium]|nr:hypothetical protein [Syntrophorhabdaceae bacterium]
MENNAPKCVLMSYIGKVFGRFYRYKGIDKLHEVYEKVWHR